MNKMLSRAAAAAFVLGSIAVSTVPASAGGSFSIGFGGGGFAPYPYPYPPHGGGIYVDVGPGPVYGGGGSWKKHVKWCFAHYKSYDPDTNLFMSKWGYKECNSPWM